MVRIVGTVSALEERIHLALVTNELIHGYHRRQFVLIKEARVGLVNRSEATVKIGFVDTVNRLTALVIHLETNTV